MRKKRTRNFAELIRSKIESDPHLAAAIEDEAFYADIGMQIYEAREAASLTQEQLGELVGTHQSVIARMENADYDGHSLSMLRRIADALDKSIYIQFRQKITDFGQVPESVLVDSFEIPVPSWELADDWQPNISETPSCNPSQNYSMVG